MKIAHSPVSMKYQNQTWQQGTTLIVVLIFLVLLSLFGVSATQNNALQERMAGNTRNRNLAMSAAEFALKDAESLISTMSAATVSAMTSVSLSVTNDTDAWKSVDWSLELQPTQNSTFSLQKVAEQPRYRVEKIDPKPTSCSGTYCMRVTARGVGGESNAVVILQALYSYSP